jgi:hypothetical protein
MKTRFTTVDIITVLEELQPVISPIGKEKMSAPFVLPLAVLEKFLPASQRRKAKRGKDGSHKGGGGVYCDNRAGIFKKSMGARHRGGIGFPYRPARLHRLAEFIPWHQFRGPIHI